MAMVDAPARTIPDATTSLKLRFRKNRMPIGAKNPLTRLDSVAWKANAPLPTPSSADADVKKTPNELMQIPIELADRPQQTATVIQWRRDLFSTLDAFLCRHSTICRRFYAAFSKNWKNKKVQRPLGQQIAHGRTDGKIDLNGTVI
jgi:hypothetical protein